MLAKKTKWKKTKSLAQELGPVTAGLLPNAPALLTYRNSSGGGRETPKGLIV